MSKIKVTLNGEEFSFFANKSVFDLVEYLDLDITKIAIERNLHIVNSDDFKDEQLQEGDKIEIVSFIGGG